MSKFKMNLLYNKENSFCTETESLNFKITPQLAKLDMVGSWLVSNGLLFLDDTPSIVIQC